MKRREIEFVAGFCLSRFARREGLAYEIDAGFEATVRSDVADALLALGAFQSRDTFEAEALAEIDQLLEEVPDAV